MFTRIAPRYDLMNRIMTFGQDVRWRREVIQRANLPPVGWLLDLGAGTGDLAREAKRQHPGCNVIAADFTLEMMRVGQESRKDENIPAIPLRWIAADALQLPFPTDNFDAVVSGFLLRNVTNIDCALSEQFRVLKAGGWAIALDTTRPPDNFLVPLLNFHLHQVIPTLGGMLARDKEAYTYLPETTAEFLSAEDLAARFVRTGFRQVGFRRLMFGAIAIHWGRKS
jgi:demethylmenaquinone methyltransferase/2-methoxy-6-polyprenyl-1,4-benzoquinol methylase